MASSFKPLESGEPIGVVALSGPVDAQSLAAGLEVIRSWGHPVILAPNLAEQAGYLAGDDSQRLRALEAVLDHGARVLIAARGGYGVTRLLPELDLGDFARRDVMVVGYSDLTALMNGLIAAGGGPQIHGPMVASGLSRRRNSESLRLLLSGELAGKTIFRFGPEHVVRGGRVRGRSVGGNLAMLEAGLGTPYEAPFAGSLLFVEEVGEPLYRVDRMLTHLRGSARLRGVKALICGSLRGCRPAKDVASRWRELVVEAVGEEIPVVLGLPFGHGALNLSFPIGVQLELDTDAGTIRWRL